jgi:hypothetical protein
VDDIPGQSGIDEAALQKACAGARVVFYAASASGRGGQAARSVDYDGVRLAAAGM